MCKYAVEGFSDILRLEMRKWGVKVVIVQPGHFGGATKCIEVSVVLPVRILAVPINP